jgi:hypothetical protein
MTGSWIAPHRIPGKRIVSRRAYLLQQSLQQAQHTASVSSVGSAATTQKVDEKPWPRYIVYGAWCTAGIVIPYTIAWFLSMNAEWRSRYPFSTLFGTTDVDDEDGKLVPILRRHFGILDMDHLSEPEQLEASADIQNLPYRFVDEPSRAVRSIQKDIERRNRSQIFVQLYKIPKSSTSTSTTTHAMFGEEANLSEHIGRRLKLPASLLARTSDVQAALLQNNDIIDPNEQRNLSKNDLSSSWYWALDFLRSDDNDDVDDNPEKMNTNVTEEESTKSNLATTETTGTTFPWTIYSPWQYHHPNLALVASGVDANSNPKSQPLDSTYDLEMERINHEIQRLRDAVHERSVDDISVELQKLQAEKRRLRLQKWFPFWRSS